MTTNRNRLGAAAIAVASFGFGEAQAHHSYAAFDACKVIALEGEINRVEWVNPHIIIDLKTKDVDSYRVEWFALPQLELAHIPTGTLKTGDHVVITGSAIRDPSKKVFSLLTEIRRPTDGWSWAREPRRPPENCSAG